MRLQSGGDLMDEFNFIEYLRTEKGLNDYQIGKIQELLDSFVKDD